MIAAVLHVVLGPVHPARWRRALRQSITHLAARLVETEAERTRLQAQQQATSRRLAELQSQLEAEHAALRLLLSAGHRFSPLEAIGFLTELPRTTSGELDEHAFVTWVFDEAAKRAVDQPSH